MLTDSPSLRVQSHGTPIKINPVLFCFVFLFFFFSREKQLLSLLRRFCLPVYSENKFLAIFHMLKVLKQVIFSGTDRHMSNFWDQLNAVI